MATATELVRADQQAMVIVATLVAAQQDPALWERFTERMFDEWARQSLVGTALGGVEPQTQVASGRASPDRTAQSGVDAAAVDNHAESAQAFERAAQAFM